MRVESAKPSKSQLGGWIHRLTDALPRIDCRALPKKEKPVIDWTLLAASMAEAPTAAEERDWLARTLGLKESALVELGVGRGWDEYRGKPYSSWPERDATGKVVGIVRRYRDGVKKTMQHSSHGLYFAPPIIRQRCGPLFMPEGGSDTCALLGLGLNVAGRPSNLAGVGQLSALVASMSRKLRIVVLGERDEKPEQRGTHDSCPLTCAGCFRCYPGLFGAKEVCKRLAQETRLSIRWVLPPAKDVRAWLLTQNGITAGGFLQAVRTWK